MPMAGPGCRNPSTRSSLVGEHHRVTIASHRAHHDGGTAFIHCSGLTDVYRHRAAGTPTFFVVLFGASDVDRHASSLRSMNPA